MDLQSSRSPASPDETDAFVGKIKFDQLPAGSTVATSSILRRQQVKQLNPKLETVDIRGTIEERVQKMKDGYCDGLIVATVALKRLGLENISKASCRGKRRRFRDS